MQADPMMKRHSVLGYERRYLNLEGRDAPCARTMEGRHPRGAGADNREDVGDMRNGLIYQNRL